MRVLLTNDDGARAPGIAALYHAIRDRFDEVLVVAPLYVQSATSHGITYGEPLMTRRIRVEQFGGLYEAVAVEGRPADCTKLALTNIWPERFGEGSRPDLVISGMNMGANVGINIIYSGTVAAAIEAAFLGVPAIGVSNHLGRGTPDFPSAARHARRAIDAILDSLGDAAPTPHEMINVNVPRCEFEDETRDEPVPIVVCPMNIHAVVDRYERRESPTGDAYYWPTGDGMDFRQADRGSDVEQLMLRHTTVTPLKYDLTESTMLTTYRDRLSTQG